MAREKALEAVRASRADWAEIFADRVSRGGRRAASSTVLFAGLAEFPERSEELSRRILRSPRLAPRAFVWLCERLRAEGRPRAPATLFLSLLDALRQDEFSGCRARLKEFFEPGGLAVSLVRRAASEEEARDFLTALDRAGGLEEHRAGLVREALLMKFPALRAPAREYLYATPEAIEARRAGARAPEAGRAARQRRGDARGQGARRPDGELRVSRRAAEARVPLGADRVALRRAFALAGARSRPDRRLGGAGRDAGRRCGSRSGRRAPGDDPGPLGLAPGGGDLLLRVGVRPALLGKQLGDRVQVGESEMEIVSIEPWR